METMSLAEAAIQFFGLRNQAPVVRKVDNAIHWINHYPADSVGCNGNRTEWSPIRSVIIRVITKSDDRAAEVRFVNREFDY